MAGVMTPGALACVFADGPPLRMITISGGGEVTRTLAEPRISSIRGDDGSTCFRALCDALLSVEPQ
jgi:hypothetical protein